MRIHCWGTRSAYIPVTWRACFTIAIISGLLWISGRTQEQNLREQLHKKQAKDDQHIGCRVTCGRFNDGMHVTIAPLGCDFDFNSGITALVAAEAHPNVWAQADALAKVTASTVSVDLGQLTSNSQISWLIQIFSLIVPLTSHICWIT